MRAATLTAWREETSLPELRSGIDRLPQAINEIEEDSKAVLDILVAALDAAFLTRSKPR